MKSSEPRSPEYLAGYAEGYAEGWRDAHEEVRDEAFEAGWSAALNSLTGARLRVRDEFEKLIAEVLYSLRNWRRGRRK